MPDPNPFPNRPLSPHLEIYRWPITMTMSILHRITGVALYLGTLLLAWWLVAAATGPQQLSTVQAVLGHPLGLMVLFGYTWALMHHMLGGIRHFLWDMGLADGPAERVWLSAATMVGSVALTLLLWLAGFFILGGTN
jgi:succinate dehydrogenase / fumarate reductase cytochrome b subunit